MAVGREGMRLQDAAPDQSQRAGRSFQCEADVVEVEDWKTKRPWIGSSERWSTFAHASNTKKMRKWLRTHSFELHEAQVARAQNQHTLL